MSNTTIDRVLRFSFWYACAASVISGLYVVLLILELALT